MIGKTIGHYRVIEELGRGGMGVVYKAHDTRLDRDVALKFLPHDLSSTEEERARFLQEARAAATLNHAHICTIYAIEESDGEQFIAMEYIDGVTLRKKIGELHRMKLEDVVSLGVQIGDALHEAHSKGIVHRDVKAENIMVNHRNQPKVMDFGLAKLKGSLKLTKTSSTVGTLAYMAPEQIQGGEVDARSDIFSFGVVIFEMLTGQTPFRGEHEAAMMYSILNEEAEPVSKYIPDASPELLHILNRALEKDPEDRYQTVHDMVIDLRRLKKDSSRVSRTSAHQPIPSTTSVSQQERISGPVAATAPRRTLFASGAALAVVALLAAAYFMGVFGEAESTERLTVAVADFVNDTNEPELNGLSGMLITSMEQSRRLTVMTRARMFDVLKQHGKDHVERIDDNLGREIAQAAGVDALVTASIRKFGKLYSIDLKVLDPKKDEYLFTAKEEGEGQESIPQMLDRLSEKTRIGLKEKAEEVRKLQQSVAAVTTSNLEAYQHYFRGEELINRLKFTEAEEEFRKAVALDTSFGLAHYRLGYAIAWFGEASAQEHITRAMQHLDRIPEREQFLVRAEDVRLKLGMEQSIAVLKEMEKQYPDDKEMLYAIGDYSYHSDDFEQALSYLGKTLTIDPKFERALQHLTWAYRDLGRYEQMIEMAKRYVAVSGSGDAYALLGYGYSILGKYDEGVQTLKQARGLFPDSWEITVSIARLHLDQGDLANAGKEITPLLAKGRSRFERLRGLSVLTDINLYEGKFEKAMDLLTEEYGLHMELKDTVEAATTILDKASIDLALFGAEKAWSRFRKAMDYPRFVRTGQFPVWYSYFSLLRGDVAAADSTMPKEPQWVRESLVAYAAVRRGQCTEGELLRSSESSWRFVPSGFKYMILYDLALCQLLHSSPERALKTVQELQAIRTRSEAALVYPRSFLLAGRIYEEMGDRAKAKENYERFLSIWKDADRDLPDYKDASARLAKLKGSV